MKHIDPEAIHTQHGCVRYWSDLKHISKINRVQPTLAEKIMWDKYLSNDKTGYRFVRQKPIYRFVVDFYCSQLNLAIEIDGDSHIKKKSTDKIRDKLLKQIGINTIRFTNDEVVNHPEIINQELLPIVSKRGVSEASGEIENNAKLTS